MLQADGKIVVAGSIGGGARYDFILVRYNADRSLDTGFGSGGVGRTDFFGNADICFAVALQSDGKILAAGTATLVPVGNFALVRYNSDGSLDQSFGAGGKVTTHLFDGLGDRINAIAIQPDGKIVAAGAGSLFSGENHSDFALARYNTDEAWIPRSEQMGDC